MKLIKLLTFLFLFLVISATPTNAVYDPGETTNNHFGIHIIEQSDLEDAQKLVNSGGGEWGYITLVIRQDQRNFKQWDDFFKKLRSAKLIPIVRLATKAEGSNWIKPTKEEARDWADFLDNLSWPIKNRYVILFNEPNHAQEWGEEINPGEYAQIALEFIHKLKEKDSNFYLLNAGFDMAASNLNGNTMEAVSFWHAMEEKMPGIFQLFDGWNSHSYPNPGFSQSPYNIGKTSIVSYRFEQDYLESNFNTSKKPLFITETGWITGAGGLSESQVASYYKTAFEEIWTDDNIVAITPFLLNYPEDLFASFSWKHANGEYKKQYSDVLGITKNAGSPLLAPYSAFGRLISKIKTTSSKMLSAVPDITI